MAKLVIYTKDASDGSALKTALTNNSIPFTEVRVDQLSNRDIPDMNGDTREYTGNEIKALLRHIWAKVQTL